MLRSPSVDLLRHYLNEIQHLNFLGLKVDIFSVSL